MASTYTPLGIELQATGENAGTWGTKTNTNLSIIEQISGGFTQQAVSDSGDTDLSVSDGSTGATLAHRMIEFTGTLSAGRNVTIPIDVQTFYFLRNSTGGSQTVTFKYVSGSGDSVAVASGATKIVFASANDGTNPDIIDMGFGTGDVTLTGTQTLTNKTLTSPKIGTSILDTNGNELFKLTATGSAVNELTYANAATGNKPTFTATGGDTNIGVSIQPKGSGQVTIDNLTFPAADGSADQVLKTDGSGNLSFTDMEGGAVTWQTGSIKTSGFTAAAGEGYFCNTTGGTFTATLPSSPSAGNIVAFKDYAGTFDTNKLTVARNGSNIDATAANVDLTTEAESITFIYVDGTQGWKVINNSDQSFLPQYPAATGGTVTCTGDFKIHTFTSPGTFCVTNTGNEFGNNKISYLIIAGGGGGGSTNSSDDGGGGGAGGYREGKDSSDPYSAAPPATTHTTLSTTGAYSIAVGSGGSGGAGTPGVPGTQGSDSSFNGISSAGGGGARGSGGAASPSVADGGSGGGSGGGGGVPGKPGGSGNVPLVSPSQGNDGGSGASSPPDGSAGGGGGIGSAGGNAGGSSAAGGSGAASSINGTPTSRAGGGGAAGQSGQDGGGSSGGQGTANTGGGGGGNQNGSTAGSGGSGLVIIRYKYQN